MQTDKRNRLKKIVDICMTIALLLLMAYQVTGEVLHEWIGIIETVLVIIHQILNRKWYGAVFKGKYSAYRVFTTAINVCLVASFLITAFCGMSMSGYAVPFLYGLAPVSFVRRFHLAMSHWTFVLMGLHLGFHIPVILSGMKVSDSRKKVIAISACILSGYGLYLFLKTGMPNYLFFRASFAFLDYEKATVLVFAENLSMLLLFAFIGAEGAVICRNTSKNGEEKKNPLIPVVLILAAVIFGLILNTAFGSENNSNTGNWSDASQGNDNSLDEEKADEENSSNKEEGVELMNDGYILINAGTFLMGSPESENWRIDDEIQHEVSLSPFYIDPYETTQAEYESMIGENPSTFKGDNLPVTDISWLDAIRYANERSERSGLTPVYTIFGEEVRWDRSANGYRLPTEAEWEYACRAGTTTPFNTETSISTDEANYWGSYPYEIEENYFDNSALETKPGSSKGQTVSVGSYPANKFGLYDMHGNVNEWCWDYYGAYDTEDSNNPIGAVSGTRHIYRGGGWNDFAKNLRSAYRAAGQSDLKSHNLGIRLVRNADSTVNGTVTAQEDVTDKQQTGNILIVYYSWGGNTRGIAEEIRSQTGADIFEITLVNPYSMNYNTVLMEAQEDQHNQARPEIENHIDNFDDYDVILLGYPNWWASIPMPIASFLEEYSFSGKRIIPFCSHGGGRFGQSLTAIAKLASDADMGEGLAINYSGGASMPGDVADWLDNNGISHY